MNKQLLRKGCAFIRQELQYLAEKTKKEIAEAETLPAYFDDGYTLDGDHGNPVKAEQDDIPTQVAT